MARAKMGLLIHALHGQMKGSSFLVSHFKHTQSVRQFVKRPQRMPIPTPPADPSCPCEAFKYCDLIYQGMTEDERDEWRGSVTRPATSGYDLWMKECLTLVNAGEAPPDHPSPSGGFSAKEAQPGEKHPGLEICGWVPPMRYDCTGAEGDPPWECIEAVDGEFETLEECEAECEAPPPPPCPPCAGEPSPAFDYVILYEEGVVNRGYDVGCLMFQDCGPPPRWICQTAELPIIEQLDGYARLTFSVDIGYGLCYWEYRAEGNDCLHGRSFWYHSRSGEWCLGADPVLPIAVTPTDTCPWA